MPSCNLFMGRLNTHIMLARTTEYW